MVQDVPSQNTNNYDETSMSYRNLAKKVQVTIFIRRSICGPHGRKVALNERLTIEPSKVGLTKQLLNIGILDRTKSFNFEKKRGKKVIIGNNST